MCIFGQMPLLDRVMPLAAIVWSAITRKGVRRIYDHDNDWHKYKEKIRQSLESLRTQSYYIMAS